jgi:hypothetical protein
MLCKVAAVSVYVQGIQSGGMLSERVEVGKPESPDVEFVHALAQKHV